MKWRRILSGLCLNAFWVLFFPALILAADGVAVPEAAARKDWEAVRDLVQQGADVNAAQGDGMTALHWVAMHGQVDVARTLISAGARVAAPTRINSYTPLFLASQYGHAAVVEVLLKAHAVPGSVSSTGSTPLMLAAASGSVDTVKLLLDAGADVNTAEWGRGQTALMYAAAYNRAAVIKVFAARGATLNATSAVLDLFALTREEESAEAPQNPRGRSRSRGVPGRDRNYTYSELVGYEGGLTPLLFAARQGHVKAVEALIEAGADINAVSAGDGTSPLLIAAINGHFDLAQRLLDQGADPNLAAENGVRPLYAVVACQWAAIAAYPQPRAHLQQRTTYLALMKALLEKGAEPNARLKKKVWYSEYNHDESNMNEIGATPLWRAAYAGDVDAIRLLVAYGADPNVPTMTPASLRRGYVTQGDGTDHSGLPPPQAGAPSATPLLAAAGVGYGRGAGSTVHRTLAGWLPAVRYLVELGVDVNEHDAGGDTALHYAAARGDNEMILFLISHGADVTSVNRAGQTVADMANGPTERGVPPFPETLTLLEKLGVAPNYKCTLCS